MRTHSTVNLPRPTADSVGIIHYLCGRSPLTGKVKARFGDFLVKEVTSKGQVLSLQNLVVPDHLKAPQQKAIDQSQGLEMIDEHKVELSALLGDDQLERVREFVKEGLQGEGENKAGATMMLEPDESKEHRKAVHTKIRELLPFLDTGTAEREDGQKTIQVMFKLTKQEKSKDRRDRKNRKRDRSDDASTSDRGGKRGRDNDGGRLLYHSDRTQWPTGRPPYLHFTLTKENQETHNVLSRLASLMHINVRAFEVAGTKDKRGVTTQRVSAFKVEAERLARLNEVLPPSIRMGEFAYEKEPLHLGNLYGNHFDITIRDVTGPVNDHLPLCLEKLRTTGFPNYFGMQRFGTNAEVPTHAVGAEMLKGNYQNAVSLILKPRKGDDSRQAHALRALADGRNKQDVLDELTYDMVAERAVVKSQMQNGSGAWLNAIMAIPTNLRTMYLHAFQSVVFNTMVTRRLGMASEAIIGDLALDTTAPPDQTDAGIFGPQVRVLSSQEEASTCPLHLVVLPLPGHSVTYPTHSLGEEAFRAAVNELGVPFDVLQKSASGSPFALSGSYRPIVCMPQNMSGRHVRYEMEDAKLTVSELDVLNERRDVETSPDGSRMAIQLKFTLPASSYATMLLREVIVENTQHFDRLTSRSPTSPSPATKLEEAQDGTITEAPSMQSTQKDDVQINSTEAKGMKEEQAKTEEEETKGHGAAEGDDK